MSVFTDVAEFHAAADLERPSVPTVPGPRFGSVALSQVQAMVKSLGLARRLSKELSLANGDDVALRRVRLMVEELTETVVAILEGDVVGTTDGLTDLQYVTAGSAVDFGIDLDWAHRIVHHANMAKRNPATGKFDKDPANKIIKPEGWVGPEDKLIDMLISSGWEV